MKTFQSPSFSAGLFEERVGVTIMYKQLIIRQNFRTLLKRSNTSLIRQQHKLNIFAAIFLFFCEEKKIHLLSALPFNLLVKSNLKLTL